MSEEILAAPTAVLESDYKKYRGKCKEYCDVLVEYDPTLRLVRGFYNCPMWGEQQHWWCVKPDGTIVDPTAKQFPTKGTGVEYVEFDGIISCAECGNDVSEADAQINGNYGFCSTKCACRFVGIGCSGFDNQLPKMTETMNF